MSTLIEHHDVFLFEGLSLTDTPPGLTRPAGTIPEQVEPTATGNIVVKVLDVTWTGDLRIIRGHINPSGDDGYDGGLIFPDNEDTHAVTIPITTATTLITQRVWRRYNH